MLIEATRPDGSALPPVEVTLTKSGVHICYTDADGSQALIPRYSWQQLAAVISDLFDRSPLAPQVYGPDAKGV